ncbi:MAG: TolC family protein [Ferruginibacter sp.]
MKKTLLRCLFIYLLLPVSLQAQQATTDTTLRFTDYLQWVNDFHPEAQQARLLLETAKAAKQAARGQFDPKSFYQLNNKNYDGKEYFNLTDAGLNIPTFYGVDLKTGFERNVGINLNPEAETPSKGLFYTQFSIPLAQGLLMDERRTALKQANLLGTLSIAERQVRLNDLFLDAGKAYFDWALARKNLTVYQYAYQISQERFNAVRRSALLGDRPFIDTVEAGIQMQDRLVNLNQAQLDWQNRTTYLNTFLWSKGNAPVTLQSYVLPDTAFFHSLSDSAATAVLLQLDKALTGHPLLQWYSVKINQATVDRRMKQEKLKPQINLLFNPLFDAGVPGGQFLNNYKWGIGFQMPLLLRKERGELRMARIKVQEANLQFSQKSIEVSNKIRMAANELINGRIQYTVFKQNLLNYESLWRSEQRLFLGGESSLFMINSRENSYINAQIKANELLFKLNKASLAFVYAQGQLSVLR